MIERTRLRLLALKALTNNFSGTYPTLAENRVYDSRLDSYDVLEGLTEEPLPRIGIYTSGHTFDSGGMISSKRMKLQQDIDIMFEISVFGHKQATYNGNELVEDEQLTFNDQYLSMKLDILEQQIFDALYRAENEHTNAFKKFASGVNRISSHDDMSAEGQHKISMRTLEINVRISAALCNTPYDPATTNWIDLYPDLRDLIDCPAALEAVSSIPVANPQDNLNSIELDLNSSRGIYPDTVTKVKVDLNE